LGHFVRRESKKYDKNEKVNLMEGILLSIDPVEKNGKVDTRNDKLGVLTIYFGKELPDGLSEKCTVQFEVKVSKVGNTYAKFTAVADRNIAIFNTEDRAQWYTWGENREEDFITKIVPKLNLDIRINPEKETCPWALDFYDFTNHRLADLKTQNTPFFTAWKYSYKGTPYNATYTVTFNKKDYEHYLEAAPNCDIYFWIDWRQTKYKNIQLEKLNGVWRASFSKMAEQIQSGSVALHQYLYRTTDDHNAKDSYLFLLSDPEVFQRLL
jgi:hypothetical protein